MNMEKNNGVEFALSQLEFSELSPDKLPLAYKNKLGVFVIVARISGLQALVQDAESASPEVISTAELAEKWSGEVIRLQGAFAAL